MGETDPGLLWALSLSNQSNVPTKIIKTMHKHLPSADIEVRQGATTVVHSLNVT